jgi:hypothetical protein
MNHKINSKQNGQHCHHLSFDCFSFFPYQIWSSHVLFNNFFFFYKKCSFVQNKHFINTKSLNNLQVRKLSCEQEKLSFETLLGKKYCITIHDYLYIYVCYFDLMGISSLEAEIRSLLTIPFVIYFMSWIQICF